MNILFVVGTCLSKNTSANMSHNSYIQGLADNGCNVDVVMKTDSWGQTDCVLSKIPGVNYIDIKSDSIIDKLRRKFSGTGSKNPAPKTEINSDTPTKQGFKITISALIKSLIKKSFFLIFPDDKLYPLDKIWLKCINSFSSTKEYDIVISNSSPAASHKAAEVLIKKNKIRAHRWIQIWEDPWYFDLYGNHSELIKAEEQKLLNAATEILYVSPITTEYQKQHFPSAAHKMGTIPLPFFNIDDSSDMSDSSDISYGYFGDYYSKTRNILPLFHALNNSKRKGYIYGDTDLLLHSDTLEISPRVTLDILSQIQKKTRVLIHLSNLHGGQIPGKIYHYSATTKPILFILDGTQSEIELLRSFFGKLNRYYFCDNEEESILKTLNKIENDIIYGKLERPLMEFSPQNVIKKIL